MKKGIVFFLLMWVTSQAIAQYKVHYEILENDPLSNDNLIFHISPLTFTSSNNTGILFGLGGSYIHNDQIGVDFAFRRSYTEKLNEFISDFDGYRSGNQYIEPMTPDKHLTYFELNGQYFLGSRMTTGDVKVEIASAYRSTTYMKVPAERLLAFPVRFGYTHYQTIMSTSRFMDRGSFSFKGVEANSLNSVPSPLGGIANFSSHFLHLGFGVYFRDNVRIQISDPNPEYQGFRNKTGSMMWYADLLLPLAQKLENVVLKEKTFSPTDGMIIKETPYNIDDHTEKTSFGVRTGVRQDVMGARFGGVSYRIEFGYRPGPIDIQANYYLIFGLDLLISKRTF